MIIDFDKMPRNNLTNPFYGPIGKALIVEELPQVVEDGAGRWFLSRVNIRSYDPNWAKLDDAPDFTHLEDAERWCQDRQIPFEVRPIGRA